MTGPEGERPRYDPPLIVPWTAIGVLVIAFILLALAARGPNTLNIDLKLAEWVQQWDGPVGEGIAIAGNFLGWSAFGLTMLAAAWVGFAILRRKRELWFTLILAIERLFATLFKDVFDSPRPNTSEATVRGTFDHWGFPSGHVTTATICLGAIAWSVARFVPGIDLRLLGLLWALGVAMTAWARMWYGAHWFSDTVGGALIGVAFVALASNLSFGLTLADRATLRPRSRAKTLPPPTPPSA